MTASTRVCLVLLQLVIGWHLFYEGWWKLREPSWSSRGYLRNAQGPAALWLRSTAGDPEVKDKNGRLVVVDPTEEVKARFTIKPLDPNEAPEVRRWHKHLPPPVEREWDDYFAAFVKNYKLEDGGPSAAEPVALVAASPEAPLVGGMPWGALVVAGLRDASQPLQPSLQRILAERNLLVAKAETARWIAEGTKKVKRPPISVGEVTLSTPQRVREYLDKADEVQDLETNQMDVFGAKVADKYRRAKGEENALRAGLMNDLNEQTAQMKQALRDVLGYEQKRMALPEEPKPAAAGDWKLLPWIDGGVKWGLLIAGACLMLGLFTRLACLAGMALLLMFYVAMPALPGLPPSADGHYLLINLNIVEAVALLTIAVAHTGRWYGLGAWLGALKPWRWRSAAREGRPFAARPPHAAMKEVPLGNGGTVVPRK